MNSTRRFGIVTGCLIAMMATLAFIGVNFATKPVSWMRPAFLIVLLLLTIGIAWAFHPLFLKIHSVGMRYLAASISVLVAVLVFAWLAYALFGNLWFLFGGSI
jgi:hypothetical protein